MEKAKVIAIIEKLMNGADKEATEVKLHYVSSVKTDKNHKGDIVEKETVCFGRFGLSYEKEMKALNPDWVASEQKSYYSKDSESEYLSVLNSNNAKVYLNIFAPKKNTDRKVSYFLNGEESTKEEVQSHCIASAFNHKDEPFVFYRVNIENIISIG